MFTNVYNSYNNSAFYTNKPTAWNENISLAFLLFAWFKPKVFVELGTHWGNSYFNICNFVKNNSFDTMCYAIDHWAGDDHAGFYGDEVYEYVSAVNAKEFSDFSKLMRMSFAAAADTFEDSSVDLIHIDGRHGYDDVKEDFFTWLPKLKSNAVVMLHDICVDKDGFGVKDFWTELKDKYSNTFEYDIGAGLGVVQLGDGINESFLSDLLGLYPKATIINELIFVESKLSLLKSENLVLRSENHAANSSIRDLDLKLKESNTKLVANAFQIQDVSRQLEVLETHIDNIYKTKSWRYTYPFRVFIVKRNLIIAKVKRIFNFCKIALSGARAEAKRLGGFSQLIRAICRVILRDGLRACYQKILIKHTWADGLNHELKLHSIPQWRDEIPLTSEIVGSLRHSPKISILMPVYNTDLKLLRETLSTVLTQTYMNWEICIVNDSPDNTALDNQILAFASADDRIKYSKNAENQGISKSTNVALDQASGDYVCLLDHDDLLTPNALYYIVKYIKDNPSVEIIYTDETKISESGDEYDPFFKPDWSPALLLNCMYIGHLTVYKRSLMDVVGAFRTEYDYSQDYDYALRATEVTDEIGHVQKVLYKWRASSDSAASGAKPYARKSNIAALQCAMSRRGLDAVVEALPTANHPIIRAGHPLISIIIPSDSLKHIVDSITSILTKTDYPEYEIVIVTNSLLIDELLTTVKYPRTKCVPFDAPFNFSAKCNLGASSSKGEILLFFNDDVRPIKADWLKLLIEQLGVSDVGATSPKLLYENGLIQHAGMVTGVRGFVGTAFHCLDAKYSGYFSFAQSLRDTSVLSGACLAVKSEVFWAVNGFDAENTPIMHSDVDLCFKIRNCGYRCVYTPHAELTHIGHLSLAEADKKMPLWKRDEADNYILFRWGGYISQDPYYTDSMREYLYRDSPEFFKMWGQNSISDRLPKKYVLLVSHELSCTGAPILLLNISEQLKKHGYFPVVISQKSGPLFEKFREAGVTVIVDELLLREHESFLKLAKNFDSILVNTIVCEPVVHQLTHAGIDYIWYLHESNYIDEYTVNHHRTEISLRNCKSLVLGSNLLIPTLNKYSPDYRVVPYGLEDWSNQSHSQPHDRIVFGYFGSIEDRKGLDGLLREYKDASVSENCKLIICGNILDYKYFSNLEKIIEGDESITFYGAVPHDTYKELISSCDAVVVPSKDDTLPLVSIDALMLSKVLICSKQTGTSFYLNDLHDALIFDADIPGALSKIISNLCESKYNTSELSTNGRACFDRVFSEFGYLDRLFLDELQ